jgi:hypothetical protein
MRKRLSLIPVAAICAALLTACGSSSTGSSSSTPSSSAGTSAGTASATSTSGSAPQLGYEGVPLEQGPPLAPANTTQTGSVHGISCGPIEQLAYHIHAHLAVFDNGTLYQLPAGVGIPGSVPQQTSQGPVVASGKCFYWLHTHTTDGVIHIESPTKRVYTLGEFFDEWHQPLSTDRVARLHGAITVYVNGKAWKKSPRDVPLLPHADIQLEIGQPKPPIVTVNWSQTRL